MTTAGRARSAAVHGLEGRLLTVEVGLVDGPAGLVVAGLPEMGASEVRDRLRAAMANSGEPWPARQISVAVQPPTALGSSLDLAIAVGVAAASGSVPSAELAGVVLLGELGLDGRLRPVPGVLPSVHAAARGGLRRVLVAAANAAEAVLVPGIEVYGVDRLADVFAFLRGTRYPMFAAPPPAGAAGGGYGADMADLAISAVGRRAVEIAAAGGHHLLLVGPPGSGTVMVAEQLPGILPALEDEAAVEVAAIASTAGRPGGGTLVRRPPLQAPHHTCSLAALVGTGRVPGAVSLAHRGVLFVEDAAEFPRGVLDALRQPLVSGEVLIAQAGGWVRWPARFQLVLSARPCPCAAPSEPECTCTPAARRRYLARLSLPLLDRVDVRAALSVPSADLVQAGEATAVVAARVAAARAAAAARWSAPDRPTNAEVPLDVLRSQRLPRRVTAAADEALQAGLLGARGYAGALRVAWTVADLGRRGTPRRSDVDEAIALRQRPWAGADVR